MKMHYTYNNSMLKIYSLCSGDKYSDLGEGKATQWPLKGKKYTQITLLFVVTH